MNKVDKKSILLVSEYDKKIEKLNEKIESLNLDRLKLIDKSNELNNYKSFFSEKIEKN